MIDMILAFQQCTHWSFEKTLIFRLSGGALFVDGLMVGMLVFSAPSVAPLSLLLKKRKEVQD